jgi:hypothetical protein
VQKNKKKKKKRKKEKKNRHIEGTFFPIVWLSFKKGDIVVTVRDISAFYLNPKSID